MSENKVSIEEFDKLFCKGMFKKALVKIAQTFDQQVNSGNISADLTLSRKLDTY